MYLLVRENTGERITAETPGSREIQLKDILLLTTAAPPRLCG